MNKETITGKLDQATGAIKQKAGEMLGNQMLANSGAAEQIKGAAKETWGRTKEAAAERMDAQTQTKTGTSFQASKENVERRAEETLKAARDKIVQTAENAKEGITEEIDSFRDQTHRP